MNPTEADKSKAPSLLSRSVGLLRVELSESQIASTVKLRKEFEKRNEDNSTACDVLHNHQHLWASVGGPQVESLFRPSVAGLEKAKQCSDTLEKMAEGDDGLLDCRLPRYAPTSLCVTLYRIIIKKSLRSVCRMMRKRFRKQLKCYGV